MRKFLLLLLGLILLALLLFFCFNSKAAGIKNELVSGTQTAYKNENMDWVNVEVKGDKFGLTRVISLNGTAPSQELKTKAGLMAANIAGVEGVDNNLMVEEASSDVQKTPVEVELEPTPQAKVVEPDPVVVAEKQSREKVEIETVEVKEPEKQPEIEVVEVKTPEKTIEPTVEPEQNTQNCNKKFESIMSKYSVNFEYNSANIKNSSYPLLNSIVDVANECSDAQLSVEGHTDSKGRKTYNQQLSLKRANSVKNYLISKGIPSDKIEAIGYGELKPIATNKTKDGQKKNRRIEFKIKGVK